jgi:hypothetical protein
VLTDALADPPALLLTVMVPGFTGKLSTELHNIANS